MNKLVLILCMSCLLGCEPHEQPSDAAARAAGRFAVQSYVVFGDTVFSNKGINKIGVSDFYVVVDRKSPDSVRVGTFYTRRGLPVRFIKDVRVREANGTFELSATNRVPAGYESTVTEGSFFERTTGGGLLIPLADPSGSAYVPSSAGIVISARR